MLGRYFTPHHTRMCMAHTRGLVRTYATAVQFTPVTLTDGVLYKHIPAPAPYPNLGAIRSTATGLSEEQQTLVRKLRLEDPIKNNATYLSKYFGVTRKNILKVAPLSSEVRLKIFGIPTLPPSEKKDKPDIEKWKAMVRRKEHENWASRKDNIKTMKTFTKAMKKDEQLMAKAATKKTARDEIRRQYTREKAIADDKELEKKGFIKGGILKPGMFLRLDKGKGGKKR